MKKTIILLCLALCGPLVGGASAQSPAADPNAPKQKVYALVAAMGDQFTFVRQKMGTGTLLEPYYRNVVKVPNNALNLAALNGLDKAMKEADPNSKRVFLSLNAVEMDGVPIKDREKVAIDKVRAALEKVPQRAEWDKIMVITPSYRQADFDGMGTKLHGFGVFSQPLYSGSFDDGAGGGETEFDAAGSTGESGTVAPDGTKSSSKRYLAPYSYIQIWVLDARTLEIIEKQQRYDNQKLFDPMDTAVDIDKSVSSEYLAKRMVTLIETSSGKVLKQTEVGTRVDIGEIRQVGTPNKAPEARK